jgi:hypothetical protein
MSNRVQKTHRLSSMVKTEYLVHTPPPPPPLDISRTGPPKNLKFGMGHLYIYYIKSRYSKLKDFRTSKLSHTLQVVLCNHVCVALQIRIKRILESQSTVHPSQTMSYSSLLSPYAPLCQAGCVVVEYRPEFNVEDIRLPSREPK